MRPAGTLRHPDASPLKRRRGDFSRFGSPASESGLQRSLCREDFGDGLMAEAMEAVTDVFNWLQVRMSGEDIKIKMANKARNGGTIGRAKVGYLNQRILIDGHKVNCRGRQQGFCDLPYIPIEVLEEAVARYYGDAVTLPAEWLAEVSAGLDAAVSGYHGLSDSLRAQHIKRLDALDRKENYYLDLAAEQGWPKDKLRARIDAIRSERGQIEDTLANAEHHLDRGREVFRHALILLEAPPGRLRAR